MARYVAKTNVLYLSHSEYVRVQEVCERANVHRAVAVGLEDEPEIPHSKELDAAIARLHRKANRIYYEGMLEIVGPLIIRECQCESVKVVINDRQAYH